MRLIYESSKSCSPEMSDEWKFISCPDVLTRRALSSLSLPPSLSLSLSLELSSSRALELSSSLIRRRSQVFPWQWNRTLNEVPPAAAISWMRNASHSDVATHGTYLLAFPTWQSFRRDTQPTISPWTEVARTMTSLPKSSRSRNFRWVYFSILSFFYPFLSLSLSLFLNATRHHRMQMKDRLKIRNLT
jgi:hypothetical protein